MQLTQNLGDYQARSHCSDERCAHRLSRQKSGTALIENAVFPQMHVRSAVGKILGNLSIRPDFGGWTPTWQRP